MLLSEETIGKSDQTAIEEWKKNPTQMIVFLDADGSYSFASVNKIRKLEGELIWFPVPDSCQLRVDQKE